MYIDRWWLKRITWDKPTPMATNGSFWTGNSETSVALEKDIRAEIQPMNQLEHGDINYLVSEILSVLNPYIMMVIVYFTH